MSRFRTTALKGYKTPGYNWKKSVAYRKKTGFFKVRQSGEGHRAGYEWGEQKGIDPKSQVRKYSKNSPSFDEGVWEYKQSKRQALENMKLKDSINKQNATK